MLLQHLCSAPHVTISYDAHNDWLYIEWEGHLTLAAVQYACVEVAHCYLEHAYSRVLNSNALITNLDWDVPAWLANHFLPHLSLAGVQQLAWVYSSELRGRSLVQQTVDRVSDLRIALFGDVEEAVAWLQHTRPAPSAGAAEELPLPPVGGKLAHVVEGFTRYIKNQLPTDQPTDVPS